MRFRQWFLLCSCLAVLACSDNNAATSNGVVPVVKTLKLSGQSPALQQAFSGTVRARTEVPVAFEVPGRIRQRQVDAGQRVEEGQILFALDARDLEQQLAAADASVTAAQAELEVARADLERHRHLLAQRSISQQAFERAQLAERAAAAQVKVAQAQQRQVQILREHAVLRARSPGVLVDVTGEPGQVVAAGQPVATLADARQLEIELFLPDGFTPPEQGEIVQAGGVRLPLRLREVAGAADAASRTWRARYQVENNDAALKPDSLKLGSLVRVNLAQAVAAGSIHTVPVSALDERGEGPQVWQVVEGRVRPVAVEIIALQHETARIRADLALDIPVVALGAHLLMPGMAVRERAQ